MWSVLDDASSKIKIFQNGDLEFFMDRNYYRVEGVASPNNSLVGVEIIGSGVLNQNGGESGTITFDFNDYLANILPSSFVTPDFYEVRGYLLYKKQGLYPLCYVSSGILEPHNIGDQNNWGDYDGQIFQAFDVIEFHVTAICRDSD